MTLVIDKSTAYFSQVDKSSIFRLNETATVAQAALFANDCELFRKPVIANEVKIAAYPDQVKKLATPDTAETSMTSSRSPLERFWEFVSRLLPCLDGAGCRSELFFVASAQIPSLSPV